MTKDLKKLVTGFYDSWTRHDMDGGFERYIATDLVTHALGGSLDRESWLAMEKRFLDAFGNSVVMEVLDQLVDGDKVATRCRLTATQHKEFEGIPSTGVTAVLTFTAVDRVEGDKIVEHWLDMDSSSFLQQLRG